MKLPAKLPLLALTLALSTTYSSVSFADTEDYLDVTKLNQVYWIATKRQAVSYPKAALENDISGCVRMAIAINSDGEVEDIRIKQSWPAGIFEEVAVDAVEDWRYSPSESNPERIPVWQGLELDLKLEGVTESQCSSSREALLYIFTGTTLADVQESVERGFAQLAPIDRVTLAQALLKLQYEDFTDELPFMPTAEFRDYNFDLLAGKIIGSSVSQVLAKADASPVKLVDTGFKGD